MDVYKKVIEAGNAAHFEQFKRSRMAHLYSEPFDFWRFFMDTLDAAGYEVKEKENVHKKRPESLAHMS